MPHESQNSLKLKDIVEKYESATKLIQDNSSLMPFAAFVSDYLWVSARWSATTFQWHPTSEAPPIMGLVFDNREQGLEIFRKAQKGLNHSDQFEEIRISIIEGQIPDQEDQRSGYTVRICPEPESLLSHVSMKDVDLDESVIPMLGQWNRVYPDPNHPNMLMRFKQEFAKHNEFLLAPVTRGDDGQLWSHPDLGIIKNCIDFRRIEDIDEKDQDAGALLMPLLMEPPA